MCLQLPQNPRPEILAARWTVDSILRAVCSDGWGEANGSGITSETAQEHGGWLAHSEGLFAGLKATQGFLSRPGEKT